MRTPLLFAGLTVAGAVTYAGSGSGCVPGLTHTHTHAAAHLLEGCACACEGVERGGGDGGREARGKSDTPRRTSETLRRCRRCRRRRRRGGAGLTRNASKNPGTGPGPAPASPRTSPPLRLPGRYQPAPAGSPPLYAAPLSAGALFWRRGGGGAGWKSAKGPPCLSRTLHSPPPRQPPWPPRSG